VGGQDLQDEAEAQENAATPPACRRQQIARLPDSDERVRRGARAAETGGEPAAFSALEQNDEHEHQAIDYQQDEKKRVKH
jgi:hypothetical protein